MIYVLKSSRQILISAFLILFVGFCEEVRAGNKNELFSFVESQTQINIEGYPRAYNPSICQTDEHGILLIFRNLPNRYKLWISDIVIVRLDESLNIISVPQILDTRVGNTLTPSQAEDARIFTINGKIYLVYNDNMEEVNPPRHHRRDMYITELTFNGDIFELSTPKKLYHETEYHKETWQKNWVPFEFEKQLLLGFSIQPHEILCPDLITGECKNVLSSKTRMEWDWGPFRGGTPALLVDGEYLAFFHTAIYHPSSYSKYEQKWHYYMGAYTYNAEPPFQITKMSSRPICPPGFYSDATREKLVIFPGGYFIKGNDIYLAYGRNDKEVWIAKIDKIKLKKSLFTLKQK